MRKQLKESNLIVWLGLWALLFMTCSFSSKGAESTLLLPSVVAKDHNLLATLPDFSHFRDVKLKKETFFTTLYPIIQYENQHLVKLRQATVVLQNKKVDELSSAEFKWMEEMAKRYKVSAKPTNADFFEQLLLKVDYVPPSLALTQAAIESGWGSSRFARKGNNLFGQWCFYKGCGMVPSSRGSGKEHEVAKFKSINAAVRAYLHNINTNTTFKPIRVMRAKIKKSNGAIIGTELAKSLLEYSAEGPLYVKKLTKFINQNKLQRFNAQFEKSLIAED
jgi:Bax protein